MRRPDRLGPLVIQHKMWAKVFKCTELSGSQASGTQDERADGALRRMLVLHQEPIIPLVGEEGLAW